MTGKNAVLHIVSANDLLTGEVRYLSDSGEWSSQLTTARLLTDNHAAISLVEQAENQTNVVTDPYMVEVTLNVQGILTPVRLREIIRSSGPTMSASQISASTLSARQRGVNHVPV